MAWGCGFYAGLRRKEIDLLDWCEVDLDSGWIRVGSPRATRGTLRRVPIADPLLPILEAGYDKAGRPAEGRVVRRSLKSGKFAKRAYKRWDPVNHHDKDKPPGAPQTWIDGRGRTRLMATIRLHETRHTYASFLVRARYGSIDVMRDMGHSSLQSTEDYVKWLPHPGGMGEAQLLNDYFAKARPAQPADSTR